MLSTRQRGTHGMDSGAAEAVGGSTTASRNILALDRVGRTFDGGSIVR